ncbi:PadR family transcriptional regulator [Actinomadura rugatobispora]|uniref:PadR family transcriptional regulator n=1 Tax=Actinomadura rugatobispora TaxID=1994 RepID=A0ABW0ZXL9_9ACTN|nr:helix-turn-helix transcriptional regulator [Actinomadura rugatobispora]
MSLRYAVLGLLAELDGASGYDLLKTFEISLANVWVGTQSQIYGELGKLTADGLIEVLEEGPRGRKAYGITEAGRAALRHWLLETEPRNARRDEPLLRVFFLGQVKPEEAVAYLRGQAEQVAGWQDELAGLARTVPWDDDNLSIYGRLALEYGQRSTEMRREWLEWAIREIEQRQR